jgi:hypothetical protein
MMHLTFSMTDYLRSASACGSVNDRHRTAGGKPADSSAADMPLGTSALFADGTGADVRAKGTTGSR